ncbi:MAG TPA: cyclic pyranopterin monophosphate synthase MoaC [Tepidisphaeraceae bacterium]|nr:cyclic pyranopterin monophosphate synthase MoaC [Tepidisphaeraceae bacterium]
MKNTREKAAKLSHVDEGGRAQMVDVSGKPVSLREAVAEGFISLAAETLRAIAEGRVPKGEVLAVARVAGVMAAKKCGELIPLCHPLAVESVTVEFDLPVLDVEEGERVKLGIKAVARIAAKTGVEMEALTAVSVAALTVYDMCKAIDKGMVIGEIQLVKKSKVLAGGLNTKTRRH